MRGDMKNKGNKEKENMKTETNPVKTVAADQSGYGLRLLKTLESWVRVLLSSRISLFSFHM